MIKELMEPLCAAGSLTAVKAVIGVCDDVNAYLKSGQLIGVEALIANKYRRSTTIRMANLLHRSGIDPEKTNKGGQSCLSVLINSNAQRVAADWTAKRQLEALEKSIPAPSAAARMRI
jgi:hypothetical protein